MLSYWLLGYFIEPVLMHLLNAVSGWVGVGEGDLRGNGL